jgi:outer membrane protein assembly factor BamB
MKKRIYFFVILLLLSSIIAEAFTADTTQNSKSDGDMLWYFFADYWQCTEPIMDDAGNLIYVGFNTAGAYSSTIYFLSQIGDSLWSVPFQEHFENTPLIVPLTGEIVLGSASSGKLYCLHPDGSLNWTYDGGESVSQAAAIDPAGNIYFACDNILYCLSPSGSYQWEYISQQGLITSPLSVSQDGKVYFGTEFNKLIGVQNMGSEIFVADLFGYVRGEPTIDNDGTIYMATSSIDLNQSKIQVFSPDGSPVWDLTVYEPNSTAVIIGDSNHLYIRTINFWGGGFGRLYKIDKTTHLPVWNYYFSGTSGSASTPTVSADGTCYFSTVGSTNGKFIALNPNGTVKWQFNPYSTGLDCSPMGSILIGNDGNIFTWGMNMDYEGCYFIALEEPDEILANTPWPMLRHDNYRTGLAQNMVMPQPNIFYYSSLIDFGFTPPGNTVTDTLVIKNIGQLDLTLSWTLESDVFSIVEIINGYKFQEVKDEVIVPGDSLRMVLGFAPITEDLFKDTLFLLSNDPDQPIVKIFLEGISSVEGSIKWIIQLSEVSGGPAIDDYGTIYVTGFEHLWAINPDGQIKWENEVLTQTDYYDVENITISTLNDKLFFPRGKIIMSLDSAGTEQWTYDPPANDWMTPMALSNSGHLYFCDMAYYGGGNVYCLNQSGSELWHYAADRDFFDEPVIDRGGNIIVAGNLGNTGNIYSINPAGNLNWQSSFFSTGPVSIGENDVIYLGGTAGALGNYKPYARAYSKTGALLWSTELLDEYQEVTTEIVVGPNNQLYFGVNDWYSENGAFYNLDTDGNIQWVKLLDMPVFTTPALADNGVIYFGCENGNFYALNPDGTERWIIETGAIISSSPAIDLSGTIYFVNDDNYLYAVNGFNGGLAETPWPMKQHDTKHSSSVDTLEVAIQENVNPEFEIVLYPNCPNPVADETVFSFYLPEKMITECFILDIFGKICFQWEAILMEPGYHQLVWEKQDKVGNSLKPGIYIFKLLTGDHYLSQKIIVK